MKKGLDAFIMIYNIPLYVQKNIGFFILQKYREENNRNLTRERFWRKDHSIIKYVRSNDIILFEEYILYNHK